MGLIRIISWINPWTERLAFNHQWFFLVPCIDICKTRLSCATYTTSFLFAFALPANWLVLACKVLDRCLASIKHLSTAWYLLDYCFTLLVKYLAPLGKWFPIFARQVQSNWQAPRPWKKGWCRCLSLVTPRGHLVHYPEWKDDQIDRKRCIRVNNASVQVTGLNNPILSKANWKQEEGDYRIHSN